MKSEDLKKVEALNDSASQEDLLKKVSEEEVINSEDAEKVAGGINQNDKLKDQNTCTLCSPVL